MVAPAGTYKGCYKNCYYCGIEMTERNTRKTLRQTDRTKDHVVPKSKGGTLSPENKVYCCHGCNTKKADKSAEEFLKVKSKRQKRFEKIDSLPRETRELVHEWGFTIVDNFMMCGVKKPKHIRHLINTVITETRTGGGSVQTAHHG